MQDFLPFIVIGLTAGSVYGLAGTGLVLTYKTSGVFNFAYGAIAAVAAYVFYWLHVQEGMSWQLAALLCLVVLGPLMGLLLELLTRMLSEVGTQYQIVGMIGLTLGIAGVLTLWGNSWSDPVRVVHVQNTQRLPGDREHFGFRDGIGQPAVRGMPPKPGEGMPDAGSTWRPLPLGEFVLGYRAVDGRLPAGPPSPLDRNSTFLVYRKLEQDVAAYRCFLAGQGQNFPGGEAMLAAKLVGRWPDGTPLELSPDGEDPTIAADSVRLNDFRFGSDPEGMRCPIGAHIRRANPRDGLGFHGSLVNRHRIIRRGVPYGPALPEGEMEPDGIERGVLFYAFNASFARQFEFIQSTWLNDGNALGLGTDRDPVAGSWPETDGPDKMIVPGGPPRFVAPLPSLVTTKGGEYLWMPGLAALRAICGPLR